jgi:biotin operon repressor
MHDANLTDAARRVGWAILNHVNTRSGDAWPSYERLATVTGLSRAAVGRGVKLLLDEGYFDHIQGGGNRLSQYPGEKKGLSNRYRPRFDKCPLITDRSLPAKSDRSDIPATSGAARPAPTDEETEIFLKLLGMEGVRISQQVAAPAVIGLTNADDDVF